MWKCRLPWCVSGALEVGCGFAMFRNGGRVFPHGQPSVEQPCSDFPNTANESSTKHLLAPRPAGMAKCVGAVDPSSSWAPDVIVCDSQWDLSLLRAALTAQPAPISQLQSQRVQLGSRCWQLWSGTNPAPSGILAGRSPVLATGPWIKNSGSFLWETNLPIPVS